MMVAGVSPPKPRSESEVQSAIRLLLGQLPDVRIWRNNVGQTTTGTGERRSTVRFGLAVGSSDLLAIVAPHGRWLAIEVKAEDWRPAHSGAKHKHEEEQRQWMAIVRRFGGVAGFAQCESDALALLEEARGSGQAVEW